MKNSNDTIENRTRDLPACSAVHEPTVPPRAPVFWIDGFKNVGQVKKQTKYRSTI